MEITGKVITILPKSSGVSKATGNAWATQSFVIETLDQYPKKVCIEIFGEERINANLPAVDEVVTASFDLESREFNGKWYTSARAWKVAKGTGENTAPAAQPMPTPSPAPSAPVAEPKAAAPAASNTMEDSTELPF